MRNNPIFRLYRLLASITLLAWLATAATAHAQALSPTAKLVFGNYMLALPTYGDSVDSYKLEIQDAQKLGIDGFVLNAAAWSTEPIYQTRTANMFAAAQQLGTNFKLFFSLDLCCSLSVTDSIAMMTKYGAHPNYFTYNDKRVVTTFVGQGQGLTFWQAFRAAVPSLYFVPNFASTVGNFLDTSNLNFNAPSSTQINYDYSTWWSSVVDGLAYFTVGAMPANLASSGEAYAQVMSSKGKAYFAGVSPYFWVGRLDANLPRRYYDYNGGEGIAAQWNSIINVQKPLWVELITWNDFTESYMTPADPAKMSLKQYFWNVGPLIKSHAGYAELQKYYIQWFKSGTKPTLTQDGLFYFYRTHPKALVAPNDTSVVQYNVLDNIYVTTNLTSAATLQVTTGGAVKSFAVAAGLSHTRVPFNTGTQTIDLIRNGTTIIHLTGDPIASSITAYNFITTSGYGYFTPASVVSSPPNPPAALQVTP